MSTTDTPRTDAEEQKQTQRFGCFMVKSDFARTLERENAQLRAEAVKVTQQRDELHALHNRNAAYAEELRQICRDLRAEAERLRAQAKDTFEYEAQMEELRAENQRLKAELSATMEVGGYAYFSQQRNEAERAAANAKEWAKEWMQRAERAEADTARLDWLDTTRTEEISRDSEGEPVLDWYYWAVQGQCYTVRDAIDTARAATKEVET